MARLAGIEMNDKWRLAYALTRINGIGWSLSGKIMGELKIAESKRLSDLNADDFSNLTAALEKYSIEGDKVREVRSDIQRLRDIGSYRNKAHKRVAKSRTKNKNKRPYETREEKDSRSI